MTEPLAIQVNFGKPLPLFPLDQVALLPQQVLHLHIFEPRYRQMVEHALDGAGQIAMAVFAGNDWKQNYHGRPAVRPAVCIGQIVQHEKLPDGRFNILVRGVCRARIVSEANPEEGRLYRLVMLQPVGLEGEAIGTSIDEFEGDEPEPAPRASDSDELDAARRQIADLLDSEPLSLMAASAPVLEYVRNDKLPTTAILELVSFTIVSDPRLRYRLLAEPRAEERARLILGELDSLSRLINRARAQHPEEWPKGLSWN